MSNLDTQSLMKRFDESLYREGTPVPPTWKLPAQVAPREISATDALLTHWLSGRLPMALTLTMTFFLVTGWDLTNPDWLVGTLVIPLVMLLVSPLVPGNPSRRPYSLFLPCLAAPFAFAVIVGWARWELVGLSAMGRDPILLFGLFQEHLERLTDPWRFCLIALTALGTTMAVGRIANSRPWLERSRERSTSKRVLAAIPLAALMFLLLASAAIIGRNLDDPWASGVTEDPDFPYIATGRLPDSPIYAFLAQRCGTPADPGLLPQAIEKASPEQLDRISETLWPLLEGPGEVLDPSLLPLAGLVLEQADGALRDQKPVSTVSTARLLVAYEKIIFEQGLLWTHLETIDEEAILLPALAITPMSTEDLRQWVSMLPRPRAADPSEYRRFQDLTAVSLLTDPDESAAEVFLAYSNVGQDPPQRLRLFGRHVGSCSLPQLWCQLERRILLDRYGRWKQGSRFLDRLSEPSDWERWVPLVGGKAMNARAGRLAGHLKRGQGFVGYNLTKALLEARLDKSRIGSFPKSIFPGWDSIFGRTEDGRTIMVREPYRSDGKTATLFYRGKEWDLP